MVVRKVRLQQNLQLRNGKFRAAVRRAQQHDPRNAGGGSQRELAKIRVVRDHHELALLCVSHERQVGRRREPGIARRCHGVSLRQPPDHVNVEVLTDQNASTTEVQLAVRTAA